MSDLVEAYRRRAKKAFGQHFLVDPEVVSAIAAASGAGPGVTVLEIGPGAGTLTEALLLTGADVVAIEKDRDAVAFLQGPFLDLVPSARERLRVVSGDALRVDLCQLLEGVGGDRVAAGNLPYNVGTAILQRFMDSGNLFRWWTFMFQREVAKRLIAGPGSKAYSSLSLAVHNVAETRSVLDAPPTAFEPQPKVHSSVVRFEVRSAPLVSGELAAAFERVARAGFSKRRKTLSNALKSGLNHLDAREVMEMVKLSGGGPKVRAEQVPFEGFLAMARQLVGLEAASGPESS